MIKIETQDTIIDIVNKINNCNEPELILSFPMGHNILHNYMSLKILKSKAWNKKITISTSDLVSKKIWTPLWINYTIIKDWEIIKKANSKQKLMKKNYSFFGYFIYVMREYFSKFYHFALNNKVSQNLKYSNALDWTKRTWVLFLLFSLLISLWMLAFIFYFAVSKTYVEIVPEVNIRTQSINMIFTEDKEMTNQLRNDFIIPLTAVNKEVKIDYTHATTWIDYTKTKLSSWEIIFVNEMKNEQVFRPKTRVLSPEWIVFETSDWVKVPPISKNEKWETVFWTAKAFITAQTFDITWKFVWARWNIESWTFTIPWLKFNQDKIYAKLEKPLTWWDDKIVYVVSDDDIKKSQEILKQRVKETALAQIKEDVNLKNQNSGIKYEILWIDNIITYDDFKVFNLENIKSWTQIPSFTISWSVNVKTYIYNKNVVLNLFSTLINQNLLKWTDKLMFIDEKSIRITNIVDKTETPLTVKATTEIDLWVSFDFDNNSNFYNQKLKQMILGLSNTEAKSMLINEQNIANVYIKNTPFFIRNVSNSLDNIILRIRSSN